MSDQESKWLFQRSDGLWEDGNGNFAVVISVPGRKLEDGLRVFSYRLGYQTPPVTIKWDPDHVISLFPQIVSEAMIRKGYARHPIAEEVEAFEAKAGPRPNSSSDAGATGQAGATAGTTPAMASGGQAGPGAGSPGAAGQPSPASAAANLGGKNGAPVATAPVASKPSTATK